MLSSHTWINWQLAHQNNKKLSECLLVFINSGSHIQKAYYALKMLGKLEKVHKALFAAIHQYKKPLSTLDDIGDWLVASFGLDKQSFLSTAQSFTVDNEIRKGKKMAKAMGLGSVPRLIVNGKYASDFAQLKTVENIIKATLHLAEKSE